MLNNKKIPNYLTPENLKEYLFKIFENKNINIDIDNSGNVIIHKIGKGKKIAVAVPINTEELYVTHFENDKVYFNLKDNANKESIKNDIYNNIDMYKWKYVYAKKLVVVDTDEYIFAVMGNMNEVEAVVGGLKVYAEENKMTVGEVMERFEE